jgi:histidinol-phosphatase (PHP family)
MLYYDYLLENKKQNSVFHVHTYRCGHAEKVLDEEYVKKAVSIGSKRIYFSDHAPFPGDPFSQGMKYSELDEYMRALSELREKYKSEIDVKIGLEIEYLTSYDLYYQELKERLDFLLLGQHIYESAPGVYHFENSVTNRQRTMGIFENIENGLGRGYFDCVAHPDRYCDRYDQWNAEYQIHFDNIKQICREKHIWIEYNLASAENCVCSRRFWREMEDNDVVIGCDAHCLADIGKFEPLCSAK